MCPGDVGLEVVFPNKRGVVSTSGEFQRVIGAGTLVLIVQGCGDRELC